MERSQKKTPDLRPREVKIIRAASDPEDRKQRVAAYCRVSTDSDDQVNSFLAQVKYYNDFLGRSDRMTLVDIYADEGITGSSVAKRDEFNRMIRDCKLGKIDRVYVKSVSRFARNSLECIEYIRLMKSYGVTVFFENDGLDTANMNSEMILFIKSAFAQSELLAGSQRMTTAIRMKMETGDYFTAQVPYGYRVEDRKLVVFPSEAEIVKQIFAMYMQGYGTSKIIQALKSLAPDSKWSKGGIRYILQNEKYIGDSLFQKTYTPLQLPLKNRKNRGEVDQYYVSNTHEPIIDRETFQKVQTILAEREEQYKPKSPATQRTYSGKIICGDCGRAYKLALPYSNHRWVCTQSGLAGKKCCSTSITESDLEKTFVCFYNRLKQHDGAILSQTYMRLVTLKRRLSAGCDEIADIDEEIASLSEENSMYIRFFQRDMMDEISYREQTGAIQKRIAELRGRRQKLLNDDAEESCILSLRRLIEDLKTMPDALLWFDADVFHNLISHVIVASKTEVQFELKCGLKLREKIVWD